MARSLAEEKEFPVALVADGTRAKTPMCAQQPISQPQAAELHGQGLACFQRGDVHGAIGLIHQAIAVNPSVADYYSNLAVVLKGSGAAEERIALYRRASRFDPRNPITHANLAAVLTDRGDYAGAEAEARVSLVLTPSRFETWLNLGGALAGRKAWTGAIAAYARALCLKPDDLDALQCCAKVHAASGRFSAGVAWYNKARTVAAALSDDQRSSEILGAICHALGNALHESYRYAEAELRYREALCRLPGEHGLFTKLGTALLAQGKLDEAAETFRRVVSAMPHLAVGHVNLGTVLQTLGRADEALSHFRTALGLDPRSHALYSNLGTSLTYSATHGPADLKRLYDDFDRIVAQPLRDQRPHANDRNPDRRLRIGYVSPDFREHAVAYFALPLLEGHHADQIEVVCYYSHRQDDDWTGRFRQLAGEWVDCAELDDASLAERIRGDRIDILVDLAGHTEGGRLRTFARKPAPVQVTWMGYVTTTGLSAMDYRLTHADVDPPGADEYYSERLVRLPGAMWCFRPLPRMPEVTPPPFRRKGHVTFGSFNRFSKVSPRVLECWATILAAVPESRLLLCIPEGKVRQEVVALFARHGVRAGRLTFYAKLPHEQFWEIHGEVDIALDPFPFNGGTTTCETLWQGVPLVSCSGGPDGFTPRFASRMGLSFLMAVGLPELVATTESEYVRIACALAGDPGRMTELRGALRERMANSPLTDERRFVREVEAAYRTMWKEWLQVPSP